MLDDLVADAIAEGETEFDYGSCYDAQKLLTEFNLNAGTLLSKHGEDAIGDAIWYLYGCVSGMIHDVLHESVSEGFPEFYSSMKTLYDEGFARTLPNRPGQAMGGDPLATASYMLWDMDGIEYLTFHRSSDYIQQAEPLVDFGLAHKHSAVQKSFLHLLGHQQDHVPDFVDPKLRKFLKRDDISEEIRKYALQCQTGMIL